MRWWWLAASSPSLHLSVRVNAVAVAACFLIVIVLVPTTMASTASASSSFWRRAAASSSLSSHRGKAATSAFLPALSFFSSSSSSFLPQQQRRWFHATQGLAHKHIPPSPSPSYLSKSGSRWASLRMDMDLPLDETNKAKALADATAGAQGAQPTPPPTPDFMNDFLGLPAEYVAVASPRTETEEASYVADSPPIPRFRHHLEEEMGPEGGEGAAAAAPAAGAASGSGTNGAGEGQIWTVVDPRVPMMHGKDPVQEVTPFVEMFRNSAPYISMHRGAVMVLHLPGDLIGTPAFEKTLDDVTLMSLLGVKIVIVCGIAFQVDRRLRDVASAPKYCGDVRITDSETLRIVKEEAGFARCEIESILSRGFKGRPGAMGINVVGGNFCYSAKPYGVIDGIDFGYTGEVRKIETENIMKRLEQGDVVLLTTLGYSASGQTFNVVSEHLASEAAAALQANKLLFITEGQTLVDTRTGHVIQSMRLKDAKALLEYHNIVLYPQSVTDGCMVGGKPVLRDSRPSDNDYQAAILRFTRYSVQALLKGVRRAHLVAPGNGRLVQEIFTRDGAGTLISRDLYDGIRPATVADVPGIIDIIEPLVQEGVLTRRSRKDLEHDVGQYYVFTRDGLIVACGQLRKFGNCAEIGCLAVHPSYRKGGRGDAMLAYLERIAVNSGLSTIFVLSTRTMQWFLERGFEERGVEALPESRRDIYNWERKSKIYMKDIITARALDEEELFYNV